MPTHEISRIDADKAKQFEPVGMAFRAAHFILDGVLQQGSNMVQLGTTGKDLVRVQSYVNDQTTGTARIIVDSVVELLGITDTLELKNYMIRVTPRLISGSDMATTDDLQIIIVGSASSYVYTINSIGASLNESAMQNGIMCHLDADHDQIKADASNWAATETHSYRVTVELWRLHDEVGQYSL